MSVGIMFSPGGCECCDDNECTYNEICVTAFNRYYDITGAEATIQRYRSGPPGHTNELIYEDYPIPEGELNITDKDGKLCVKIPITYEDKDLFPLVDSDGGGSTPSNYLVGTYNAYQSSLTNYGETKVGPGTEFQIGVPNPNSVPKVDFYIENSDSRDGNLEQGIYYLVIDYFDDNGSTLSSKSVKFQVGYKDPVFQNVSIRYVSTGGSLPPGQYTSLYAVTDGVYHTTPKTGPSFVVTDNKEIYKISGNLDYMDEPATGINIWLSNNNGDTWRLYKNNESVSRFEEDPQPPIFDFDIIFNTYFSGAKGKPEGNTFPVKDPRLVVPEMSIIRPNATGMRVYLSTYSTGPFSIYGESFTTNTYKLTTGFSANSTTPATVNTTKRTTPSVTFTKAEGSVKTRIYTVASFTTQIPCRMFDDVDSPYILVDGIQTCPQPYNTTGNGLFKVHLDIDGECNWDTTFNVQGKCNKFSKVFPPTYHDIFITILCCGKPYIRGRPYGTLNGEPDPYGLSLKDSNGVMQSGGAINPQEDTHTALGYRVFKPDTYTYLFDETPDGTETASGTIEVTPEMITKCGKTVLEINVNTLPYDALYSVGNGGGGVPGATVTELFSGVSAVTEQVYIGNDPVYNGGDPTYPGFYPGIATLHFENPPCTYQFKVDPPTEIPGFFGSEVAQTGPSGEWEPRVLAPLDRYNFSGQRIGYYNCLRIHNQAFGLGIDLENFEFPNCWWPLPRTLYYTDAFGSCEMKNDGHLPGDPHTTSSNVWYGGYIYISPDGGRDPDIKDRCVAKDGVPVSVAITAHSGGTGSGNRTATWGVMKSYSVCGLTPIQVPLNAGPTYSLIGTSPSKSCIYYHPVNATGFYIPPGPDDVRVLFGLIPGHLLDGSSWSLTE